MPDIVNPYIDLHTHKQDTSEDSITVYNKLLHDNLSIPEVLFSAGLHPWYADQLSTVELINLLDQFVINPNMIAFGETGLDKSCNIPLKLQMEIFDIHLSKASASGKPVILHCVKAWDELIEICNNYQITKILHGFNGSIKLTERLLTHGFHFSIGKAIMYPDSKIQSSVLLIPKSSLYCETDTSDIPIQVIYRKLSEIFQITDGDLKYVLAENFRRLRIP